MENIVLMFTVVVLFILLCISTLSYIIVKGKNSALESKVDIMAKIQQRRLSGLIDEDGIIIPNGELHNLLDRAYTFSEGLRSEYENNDLSPQEIDRLFNMITLTRQEVLLDKQPFQKMKKLDRMLADIKSDKRYSKVYIKYIPNDV